MSQIGHLCISVRLKLKLNYAAFVVWAHVDRPIEFPPPSNSAQLLKSHFSALAANVMSNAWNLSSCECGSQTDWRNSNTNFRFDFLNTASLESTNVYIFIDWTLKIIYSLVTLVTRRSIRNELFLMKMNGDSQCAIRPCIFVNTIYSNEKVSSKQNDARTREQESIYSTPKLKGLFFNRC